MLVPFSPLRTLSSMYSFIFHGRCRMSRSLTTLIIIASVIQRKHSIALAAFMSVVKAGWKWCRERSKEPISASRLSGTTSKNDNNREVETVQNRYNTGECSGV